jgi:DNA repair exonuclease SbcCD nuclease subunit
MFDGYDYVWMGHIHKPQVMRAAKSGLKHIAHVGSMDRSDFGQGEMNHDKILIYVDTENPEFFETITVPTRPLRKVCITVPPDKDTTDFVINSLHAYHHDEESLDQCIMRLDIVLENPEGLRADRDKILKYLYSKLGVHHVCSFSERHNIQVVSVNKSATTVFDNQMSIPAAIEAFFAVAAFNSEEERDEVKQLAMQCYTELKESNKNQKDTI